MGDIRWTVDDARAEHARAWAVASASDCPPEALAALANAHDTLVVVIAGLQAEIAVLAGRAIRVDRAAIVPERVNDGCRCPTNSSGDIRCHNCGERVNVRCWLCGTPRGAGPCPTIDELPDDLRVATHPDHALPPPFDVGSKWPEARTDNDG